MPVKPLDSRSLKNLLERIDFARDGQIRSLTPLSPTSIEVRLSVQDKARGFDWIDVVFVINGVTDAKLVNENILKILPMDEGISAEIDQGRVAIGIGEYGGRIDESPLYIVGTALGYEERPFSG